MLAVHAAMAVALVVAVTGLPAHAPYDAVPMVADDGGVSQWNEPAIAIGMFSGGRRRRSGGDVGEAAGGSTAQRERRQEDLSEDFEADAYDDADGEVAKRLVRRQAPRRAIESPFGQTSDTEDRVRRVAQDTVDSQEDSGPVDNDHFPAENEGKRARRTSEDAYFDVGEDSDDDGVTIDEAPYRKKRQVVGQDVATADDEDVYHDLDDQPLPVWARGTRDGRLRRQLDQTMTSSDDDQPDYIRQPRDSALATTASSGEGSGNGATEMPSQVGGDKAAKSAILETDSSEERPKRLSRAAQRGRFDGFVLAEFSGFRSGRSVRARRDVPSDAMVIKTLLEAPIDESILGELPVRRSRQITETLPQPADGGPVNFLVPLAAPQPPGDQGVVPEKVLQIYTAHEPSPVVELVTTTTPAPSPAVPLALVPVVVPESAVSDVLVSGPEVHVDVIPLDATAAATPALVQPAVAVLQPQPAAVPQPDAMQPAQDSTQRGRPVQVLQPGQVVASPMTTVTTETGPQDSTVKHQAIQEQQTAPQVPLEIPQGFAQAQGLPNVQDAPKAALPQDAVQSPQVVSQAAHAVAVTEGPDAPPQSAPASMLSPQEPPSQMQAMPAMPLEWFPAPPMYPTPFHPQGDAPPRQHFDVDSKPCAESPRWGGVVPIVEKTIEMHPDGSYMYSYETADGVRVAEAGVLKEVPVEVEGAAGAAPTTTRGNSVQGGYSYTAPDGTYVSLRYVADENGFRPVLGESLPATNARAAVRFDENKK